MEFLKRLYLPGAAVALLTLTGCYADFEPDLDSTPVLCMNSLIRPDIPVTVALTRTWRWDEGNSYDLDITVTDAEVLMTVNGSRHETLRRDEESGEWVSTYIPAVGDVIELAATSEKYGPATASVTIPQPVPIDRVEPTVRNLFLEPYRPVYRFDLDLKVWFTDPADAQNQYDFKVSTSPYMHDNDTDAVSYVGQLSIDWDREPLFSEHISALESTGAETSGYTVFSDRQISGRSYPLSINLEGVYYHYFNPDNDPAILPGYIQLTLCTVSRSYYDHVISLWHANDGMAGALGSVGLGEAVFPASNVSTGAGVVAALTPSTYTLRLNSLLEKE